MSAARTAASLRSGPGTSISSVPSASTLTDERLLPNLVMTFAGSVLLSNLRKGAWPWRRPDFAKPRTAVTSGSTSRSLCRTAGCHASHGHRTFIGNIRGPVIRRTDAEYDAVRSLHNRMIDKTPLIVVRCTDVADVVTAV